ncbi:MAG: gluconokinase [Polyangiaceae bacterium]|nr:gluconokinase [Polyangiaceae bacterium]
MSPFLVMGVAGSGKTTIGQALAARLGWPFADGDAFHPPANVAKMSAGVPLSDDDRLPWLDAIAAWLRERVESDGAVVACSALKRAYRDRLRAASPALRVVYLEGSREDLEARLASRREHFFPSALLDSQLAALEPPGADEDAILVGIDQSPERAVSEIVARAGLEAGTLRP